MTRRSLASIFAWPATFAARTSAQLVPAAYSTAFDSDGTAHVSRTIPVPKTISPEAYALMTSGARWAPQNGTKEAIDNLARMHATYPVDTETTTVAGVKATIFTPKHSAPGKGDRVLISLHGGGFTSDSGSTIESIPIAALTGTRVIAVEYRLAPEFPFPAAVDDSVAVFKDVLKTHAPKKIGIFGTSAGAVLGAQTAIQLRKLGLPLPAALGFFSGYVDLARYGDSRYIYSASGFKDYAGLNGLGMNPYVADHDRKDPVLSPIYADLKGFPPTFCMTSTRDHSKRHSRLSSRAAACGSGCSTHGLRRDAARFLVRVQPARIKGSAGGPSKFPRSPSQLTIRLFKEGVLRTTWR